MDTKLMEAARKFLHAFEEVFGNDWNYTKEMMVIENYIAPDGSFIHPNVEDEIEDWGNRAILLDHYREFKKLLSDHK